MDVIQERIEREFNIDLIMTAPSVVYHINMTDGETIDVSQPQNLNPTKLQSIEEPCVEAQIMAPQEYVGASWNWLNANVVTFVTMGLYR